MDPNANLDEQRRIVERILNKSTSDYECIKDAERLAELVETLDTWLTRGGALPTAWTENAWRRK